MKCPNCQTENPSDAKFCNGCGQKLELACPECGKTNPPGSRFCNGCGHNLSLPSGPTPKDLSFDEKLDKIQRYLPKGLTEKILSQRDKIEGERRQITVMFCDLEGFTPLVEQFGAEEAYGVMDQVYELLIHKVHDYEGTVNEMTGDGIMALFGAPIALEDAPQRAIRSAHAIHKEMARFSDRLREKHKGIPPLKMRIGIHSGPVVVGTLGNDLRVEFKAVGETVNLASRMEGLAEPGTTYVTEEMFKLTEGLFRFEALGEKGVKGKKDPVRVYQVIAPSSRRTRFDVSAERGLTPFTGRERELELLLDAFYRAKAGHGQAVSIRAEAGIGKSRLLYEFRKAIADEDATFLEGKCFSYRRGAAYYPVTDILKSNFNILEPDSDEQIRDKVIRGLKQLKTDDAIALSCLLELFSVKDSGLVNLPSSPEEIRERIIEALIRVVIKGSEIRPLVMAFEDLHWMDASSEEVLKQLLDAIGGTRVFLLFTYRPEYVHTWGGKSYHSQITLNRLSNRETLAMSAHILGVQEMEGAVEELIIHKSEGVPLFIEEFLRSMRDLQLLELRKGQCLLAGEPDTLSIPGTIRDVIMSRIDLLPEGARDVLQIGAAIEREFDHELLKQVSSLPEHELLSHLSALKDAELIFERGIYPETTYVFRHAITRDVVYDSILKKKRAVLHNAIGNAMEASHLNGEEVERNSEILAQHFVRGENYAKAAEHLRLAERKAWRTSSFHEAIALATERILCLERLPPTEDIQMKVAGARVSLGELYLSMNYLGKIYAIVAPALHWAEGHKDESRLCRIHALIGAHDALVEEDFSKSFEEFETALALSEQTGDIRTIMTPNYMYGVALSHNAEFERARPYFVKALSVAERMNWVVMVSTCKSCMTYFVDIQQGSIELAYDKTAEALRMAIEIRDIFPKTFVYTNHGIACLRKGSFEEARTNLMTGAEICAKSKHYAWDGLTHFNLAELFYETQKYDEAMDHYLKSVTAIKQRGSLASWIILFSIGLAKAQIMIKKRGIDLESLRDTAKQNRVIMYEGAIQRHMGEILLNLDNQYRTEAEGWIQKAIEADAKNGMIWDLGRDYALYGELFRRKGDLQRAKDELKRAIGILTKCGADGWVAKYEKELAALS